MSGGAAALTEVDLSGDFDPDEWDRRMAQVFNDDYYAAEDADWQAEDNLDGVMDADSAIERELERAGASSARWTQGGGGGGGRSGGSGGGGGGGGSSGGGSGMGFEALTSRLQASGDKRAKLTAQQYMDEYYALDYEDLIGGDLPTRFNYTQVPATGFGITDEELLLEDERALSKRVPLRFVKRPYAKFDEKRLKGRANRERWEARKAERAEEHRAHGSAQGGAQPEGKRKRPQAATRMTDREDREGGEGGTDEAAAVEEALPRKKKKKKVPSPSATTTTGTAPVAGATISGRGGSAGGGAMSKAMSKALKKGVGSARLEAFAKLRGKKQKKKKRETQPEAA